MISMRSSSYGFTMIEILIVIAMMGILVTAVTANFMTSFSRARDARRKSELKQIQNALESYKQGTSAPITYPAALPSCGSALISGSTTHMKSMSCDPSTGSGYYFNPNNANLTYALCACLEIADDPQGANGDCDATYTCASGKKYVVTEP